MINIDAYRCRLMLLALCPGGAAAAESNQNVASSIVTLGKLAVALMLVLLVFWAFARVIKKIQAVPGGMHSGLVCLGSLSLGQRERVVIVQAGEQQLVLGVTASQINTLHVLDEPLVTAPDADSADFRQKLTAALSRQVKP